MSIPMSLLGVIFLAILIAPALLRILGAALTYPPATLRARLENALMLRHLAITAPSARPAAERPARGGLGPAKRDPERGSVTIETVAWAVAIIAIVAIAVAAITAYVTTQVAQL